MEEVTILRRIAGCRRIVPCRIGQAIISRVSSFNQPNNRNAVLSSTTIAGGVAPVSLSVGRYHDVPREKAVRFYPQDCGPLRCEPVGLADGESGTEDAIAVTPQRGYAQGDQSYAVRRFTTM